METDIKAMQGKMLEMLLYFDSFCKKNNLRYYLAGGCLIGIVRHKGFIPWDDDIDLFMPRPDYEKLFRIWKDEGDRRKYALCRTSKRHNYHDGGASIRDRHTTFINSHSVNEDICHGLAIEIMPIDGCPSSKIARGFQLLCAFGFSLFNVQRLPDNKGRLIRTVTDIVYKVVKSPDVRYRIWKFCERQMTRYKWEDCDCVTELIGSIPGMMWQHPKDWFDTAEYLPFEGHMIPVMKGYKNYLERIWGDYMQLPPEEKRVAKHDAVCIDLENSYKKYKGVYYLVKNK